MAADHRRVGIRSSQTTKAIQTIGRVIRSSMLRNGQAFPVSILMAGTGEKPAIEPKEKHGMMELLAKVVDS